MSKIVIENCLISNKKEVGEGYYLLTIGPFSRVKAIKPGQFVHIRMPGSNIYFRRAFSIYDVNTSQKSFDLLFKIFGRGTRQLANLGKGDTVDVMGPLGNGFELPNRNETVIMAAGGIGMPPIYFLTKYLLEKGVEKSKIFFFYGGNTRGDLVEMARIRKLKTRFYPATDNGSYGFRGFVTEAIKAAIQGKSEKYRMYACGPEGMLKAIDKFAVDNNFPGQLSLEAPMPCGIGVCLGCILPLRAGGYTRVCREGPVYDIGEVIL